MAFTQRHRPTRADSHVSKTPSILLVAETCISRAACRTTVGVPSYLVVVATTSSTS